MALCCGVLCTKCIPLLVLAFGDGLLLSRHNVDSAEGVQTVRAGELPARGGRERERERVFGEVTEARTETQCAVYESGYWLPEGIDRCVSPFLRGHHIKFFSRESA